MTQIHIGNSKVPIIDYAVGAAAILGIRDSGKTVTAKGIVEQLLDHNIPVIIFDAVGKWRWLKNAAPGGKSYKVVVTGGRAPDLPLTPESVSEIVRSAVKERIPLVIDFYDRNLSKADWKRIVKTAIRIIHYENEGGPIHIVLEEAAEFVPQRVIDGDVYAEIEKVVRMGGNASVGITLINQRSQEVNKAVLEQCTILILGQQVGNKAIEAVGKWVERLDATVADEVLTTLPHLKAGQAWVWTRQNPDHPTKEQMPMCRSFHPDRRQASEIKIDGLKSSDPVDFITRLSESIPKILEQAKENDPAELKKEIAKLKRELHHAQKSAPAPEIVRFPLFTTEAFAHISDVLQVGLNTFTKETDKLIAALQEAYAKYQENPNHRIPNPKYISPPKSYPVAAWPKRSFVEPRTKAVTHTDGDLGKCERAILQVMAQNFPNPVRLKKLAVSTGYALNGGGFRNSIGKLRSLGHLTKGDPVVLDADVLNWLGAVEPMPTGEDLYRLWQNHSQLGHAEREILRVLWGIRREMSLEDLAAHTQSAKGSPFEPNGGGFRNAIGKLRSLELITGRGTIQLAEEFNE